MEYTVYHLYYSALGGLYVYVYNAADMMTYLMLSQMTKFTHSDLLHRLFCNTFNFPTVFMLMFLLCRFNTSVLTWGLCLSSSTKFLFGCLNVMYAV